MARITLEIDAPVLQALKRLQRNQGKTLGKLVRERVAHAMAEMSAGTKQPPRKLTWRTQDMGAKVDREDREAVWAVLDADREFPR